MTQFAPPPMGPPNTAGYVEPPKTSVLAILSLIFGILGCIPFVGPATGLILGIIAWAIISKSNGRVTGKGLAIIGIILSIIFAVVHVVLTITILQGMRVPGDLAKSFIQAVVDDDTASAMSALAPSTSAAISGEQLTQLRERLSDEFGTFQSTVSLDFAGTAFQQGVAPPSGQYSNTNPFANYGQANAAAPIPIKMGFSSGTVYGVMMMDIDPESSKVPPLFVESITFVGKDGPWKFPPPVEEEATPTDQQDKEPAEQEATEEETAEEDS